MKNFSILIANYNNGQFFRACYESIIAQTFTNWEVIIVDDCSTDNSVVLIKGIIQSDSRFKLYENETNKGCGFTKRKCVEYAGGKLCGFLDPDDALSPIALEKSVAAYENKPEIVATYSQMTMCNENLVPIKVFSSIKKVYNDRYFFNCPIQISHFFTFRKETYLKTEGINYHLKSAVDQDLYLKILEHGDPAFIKENLYLYRLHAKGISQFTSKESARNRFAEVIYAAMKRRELKTINAMQIPDAYTDADEIFGLLNYQTQPLYRLKNKVRLLLK
ncbi:glycosyltransferase family A protein [uncultured Chryseobacterium sp.]|uniref:glycosyltransferase family 2 protein n=1 Tax=uncultured Chryseobacterium sp. TaxID=259322 RepID=UPI0025DA7B33|nr:glycosyltransferase family A protein [uncultured Chryseobacterium sp.]